MSAPRGFLDEPLRKLADQAPVLLWVARLDRCCEYVNPCWLTLTGRSFEQEIGDGWVARVHPSELDRCLSTYHWAFEAREEFRVEVRLQRADETYRRFTKLGLPRVDARGVFRGYLALALETDEDRQAERILAHAQGLPPAVLAAVPGNSAVIAKGGQILAANEAWKRCAREAGADPEAAGIGANYRDAYCWLLQKGNGILPGALRGTKAVLNGELDRFTLEYAVPSGDVERWFDLRIYPLRVPVRGAIVTHREVTRRHWAEVLARSLARADSALVHGALAHLIRCTKPTGEPSE
jgi:hypothetical protein